MTEEKFSTKLQFGNFVCSTFCVSRAGKGTLYSLEELHEISCLAPLKIDITDSLRESVRKDFQQIQQPLMEVMEQIFPGQCMALWKSLRLENPTEEEKLSEIVLRERWWSLCSPFSSKCSWEMAGKNCILKRNSDPLSFPLLQESMSLLHSTLLWSTLPDRRGFFRMLNSLLSFLLESPPFVWL